VDVQKVCPCVCKDMYVCVTDQTLLHDAASPRAASLLMGSSPGGGTRAFCLRKLSLPRCSLSGTVLFCTLYRPANTLQDHPDCHPVS
jgi:hypothetical protein